MQLKKLCPRINANHEVDFRNSDQSRSLLQESMQIKKLTQESMQIKKLIQESMQIKNLTQDSVPIKKLTAGIHTHQEFDYGKSYTSRIRVWEIIHIKNSTLGIQANQEVGPGHQQTPTLHWRLCKLVFRVGVWGNPRGHQ